MVDNLLHNRSSNMRRVGNGFMLGEVLGTGSFGKVYKAQNELAVKELVLKGMPAYLYNSLQTEINILAKITHPNIIRMHSHFYENDCAYIVMDYCEEDLSKWLKKKGGKLPQAEALRVLQQILEGFRELVGRTVIHRDLKPANILVKANGSKNDSFKLADFGFAKFVSGFEKNMLESIVGTPLYMAPQILEKVPYTTKCDIWSIGLIFYEMLTGALPWKGSCEAELLAKIKTTPLQIPTHLSEPNRKLLTRMLVVDEAKRISWQELFSIVLGSLRNRPNQQRRQRAHSEKQIAARNDSRQTGRRYIFERKDYSGGKDQRARTPSRGNGSGQNLHQSPAKNRAPNSCINCSEAFVRELVEIQFERIYGEEALAVLKSSASPKYGVEIIRQLWSVFECFNEGFQECAQKVYKVYKVSLK